MVYSPRIWQRMLSGRRLNLVEPSVLDIEIEDIARGLSRINRWSGQTTGKYGFSVAQHSVLVTRQAMSLKPDLSAAAEMVALLHDGAEYVIGDLISPFKHLVAGEYLTIEKRLQEAIYQAFGIPTPLSQTTHDLVKRADQAIAWLEATELAGFSACDASRYIARKPRKLVQSTLSALAPEAAEAEFLKRFRLIKQRAN